MLTETALAQTYSSNVSVKLTVAVNIAVVQDDADIV